MVMKNLDGLTLQEEPVKFEEVVPRSGGREPSSKRQAKAKKSNEKEESGRRQKEDTKDVEAEKARKRNKPEGAADEKERRLRRKVWDLRGQDPQGCN